MVSLILRAVFSRDNQCIICITTDHFTLTAQQSSRQRKHWRQFKVKLVYEQTILEKVFINQTVNLCCTALHCGDEWIALVVEEVESKSKVESLDSPAATAPLHCPTTDQACNVLLTCSFSYSSQHRFWALRFEKLQSCIFIHWPLCNLRTFHVLHSPRQSEDVFCSLLHTCLFVWQRSFTFSTHSHFHKGAHRDQLTTEQRRSGTSPAIIVYNLTTENDGAEYRGSEEDHRVRQNNSATEIWSSPHRLQTLH